MLQLYYTKTKSKGYKADSIEAQLECMIYEMFTTKNQDREWYPSFNTVPKKYKMSAAEFIISTESAAHLASVFMYCYERPSASAAKEQLRRDYATNWYKHFKNY